MINIVVLTKKWGRNFSGATLATQYFVSEWAKKVNKIEVITLQVGIYKELPNVRIKVAENNFKLLEDLKEIKKNDRNVLGYSDDHLGYILKKADIPYIHTYHGNWPDAKYINIEFWTKSFYFIPLYKKTIKGL